jgi:hypothetical protein
VTGVTQSTNLPSPVRAYSGGQDAFVVKLNSDATGILFTTYFGGTGDDRGYGIALDSVYDAYITGDTTSSTLANAIGTYKGGGDVFVAKVNGTTGAINRTTYLGGSNQDTGYAIAVDDQLRAYITGLTKSSDFLPVSSSIQNALGDSGCSPACGDAFVVRLDSSGVPVYSTYLGG